MPKDTYFNLPGIKRKRIFDAAVDEVLSVPISEVSINRIVQKAGISRGSFYQYFEDKQDLILYVLADAIRFIKEEIQKCITSSNGDIFAAITQILEGVFALGKRDIYRKTLRNVLVESSMRDCSYQFLRQFQLDLLDLLEQQTDREKLRLKNEQEYHNLVKILFILLKEAAIAYLYDSKQIDIYREEFASQLDMIKEGVLRKEYICQNLV